MIWKGSRLVHALLLVVALGHWTVLALGLNMSLDISSLDRACSSIRSCKYSKLPGRRTV